MAERITNLVTVVMFLAFAVLFAFLFLSGNENGSYLWYVGFLVPLAIIWIAVAVYWFRHKYILHKRSRAGFMVLDTAFSPALVPTAGAGYIPGHLSDSDSDDDGIPFFNQPPAPAQLDSSSDIDSYSSSPNHRPLD